MLNHIVHSIASEDVAPSETFRQAASLRKGVVLGPEARPMFDSMRRATPVATGVRVEPGAEGGVSGLWCRVGEQPTPSRVLFLHGGGYMLGCAQSTVGFASQIAFRCGADTFVVDYRLAPEHPFPAAFEDVEAAFRGLAVSADGPIAIAGESAGGGLALALIAAVSTSPESEKVPAVAVMSPWVDLTLRGASYKTRADRDPIFTRDALRALADTYLQGAAATDPRASPIHAIPPTLPPVRIDVGDDEVLLDDAVAYACEAAGTGADVTLSIWEGMPHVFQSRLNDLVTASKAFDEVGDFLAHNFARA